MKIFMRKDVAKIGMAGQMIVVDDGYARNFLIPKGFAVEVTAQNEHSFKEKEKIAQHKQETVLTMTSALAQKIKDIKLIIKRKTHDDGKLYGAINQNEIVELLAAKGISLSKNQLKLDKTIKNKGRYTVPVHLTSRVKTELAIEVINE